MLSGWKHWKALIVGVLLCGLTAVAEAQDQGGAEALSSADDFNSEEHNPDPFERWNRGVFKFNDVVDRNFFRPIARGYKKITPDIVEQGIGNFFSNLGDIPSAANNLLQGDINGMFSDLSRVFINTTAGILGFIDVAGMNGIHKRGEDLGQTLGVWGFDSGPYVVLPFLGPSSVRDTVGWAVEFTYDPLYYVDDQTAKYSLYALRYLDRRAAYLLATDIADQASLDPYIFYREAYLQKRAVDVRNGAPPDDF